MKVDLILTEYKRPELLYRLMKEIKISNFNRVIVHRDECPQDDYATGDYLEICSMPRVGQVIALDKLMARVTTEYYICCEEDFMPVGDYMEGIAEAIDILENNPKCGSVSLRGPNKLDHNMHPIELVDGIYRPQPNWNQWSGFSYAPSVRRLAQYKEIGSYASKAKFDPKLPWEAEKIIGNWYAKRGYWFATTKNKYFNHIGQDCSTYGK